MKAKAKTIQASGKDIRCVVFKCVATGRLVTLPLDPPGFYQGNIWSWDGNTEAPTITPSVNNAHPPRNHFFVRAGKIE